MWLVVLFCPSFVLGQTLAKVGGEMLVNGGRSAISNSFTEGVGSAIADGVRAGVLQHMEIPFDVEVSPTTAEDVAPVFINEAIEEMPFPEIGALPGKSSDLQDVIARAIVPEIEELSMALPQVLGINAVPEVDLLTRGLNTTSSVLFSSLRLRKIDALFNKVETMSGEAENFYFLTLPNLFFKPSRDFVMRLEQVKKADRFYKELLGRPNIYGMFSKSADLDRWDSLVAQSHVDWARVLYAFSGLSVLGTAGAGDAIVDATLRAPVPYRLITDYVAIHALLLLEDWPALQRFINVRSSSGYGGFPELREYLATAVPENPIYFPKRLLMGDSYTGPYHYPTFKQQLNYLSKNFATKEFPRKTITTYDKSSETYFIYYDDQWRTLSFWRYLQGERIGDYNLKNYLELRGIENEQNIFLSCISYEDGITANMARLRERLQRPSVFVPQE